MKKSASEWEETFGQVRLWYHQIEVAPGVVTPGVQNSKKMLQLLDRCGLPRKCNGMRVLDIGIRDGFYSFAMEKRGAEEVIGIDYVPPTNTGFHVCAPALDSKVRYEVDNVYNLSEERYGLFDVVLFLGVIYHLRHPLLALDVIRKIMKPDGLIFIETVVLDQHIHLPSGEALVTKELDPRINQMPMLHTFAQDYPNGDKTVTYVPNIAGLRALLESAEFEPIADQLYPDASRGVISGQAITDEERAYYRDVDAAQQAFGDGVV